jgi:bifunctional non-homologous end joining protein LigD
MAILPVSLETYKRKRDFTKTPEPDHSSAVRAARQLVVQHHYARREHFDLRLEIGGVLVSWAVTRGPSANPKDKRLAVRTEDHPLSYGSFERTIPLKQYGGGTVILWEYTTYTPLNGPPAKALKTGQIKFESHGTRMRGRWVLVRMKKAEKHENWLLIKEKDEFAEKDDSLSRRFPTGVKSFRTRRAIEKGLRGEGKNEPAQTPKQLVGFVHPQLCRLVSEIPKGNDWAF